MTYIENLVSGEFIGFKVLGPRDVPKYAERLRALPFGPIDVLQAGLYGVHPADALLWGYENLYPHYPSYTIAELRAKLESVAPDDVKEFSAVYCGYVQSGWRGFGDDRQAFKAEFARKYDAASRL